jgi:hypothetical protein
MKTLRMVAIVLIALTATVGTAVADSVGIGLTVADDFAEVPAQHEVAARLFDSPAVSPGFIVFWRDYQAGMSLDFGVDFAGENHVIEPDDPWQMDVDATATYDWHILPRFIVDPYLQLGAGMNMAISMAAEEELEQIRMAFHPVLGAGLNVYVGHIFLRGNLQYRLGSWLVPDPSIGFYDVAPYRVVLSAGVWLD